MPRDESIQPGDLVECVEVGHLQGQWNEIRWFFIQKPIKGELYTCEALGQTAAGYPGIDIRELNAHPKPIKPGTVAYRAQRFRKVHRPNAQLIEDLKAGVPIHLKTTEQQKTKEPV